jgi:deoxyadenosine/deoxycytidine kinase
MVYIAIEGNIGCGKTTFLKELENFFKSKNVVTVEIVTEPVEKWQSEDGNLLKKYYENPKKYAYQFQKCVLKSLSEIRCVGEQHIISERSLHSSLFCFSKVLVEREMISTIEYQQLYEEYEDFLNSVNFIVYLKCDPVEAFQRMQKRGRDEEKSVCLDYLQDLDRLHDVMVLNSKIPVLTINYAFCNKEYVFDLILKFVS